MKRLIMPVLVLTLLASGVAWSVDTVPIDRDGVTTSKPMTADVDYVKSITSGTTPTSGFSPNALLKNSATGNTLTPAVVGTDYVVPYGSQTANYFLASPNGSAGTPL